MKYKDIPEGVKKLMNSVHSKVMITADTPKKLETQYNIWLKDERKRGANPDIVANIENENGTYSYLIRYCH